MFSTYYYGEHKWDEYLLDIQDTIESGHAADQKAMQKQANDRAAANEEHLDVLREQAEHMRHIEDALESGLEELRAEFEWGFSLMVDRMDTQIEHLSQIAARLDAIHKTLRSPLRTQARELFQLGLEHFHKGLLDRALEAYLKAEEKNEVDFPLQLQIGKLYLYGRDEDDNVIDCTKAEKHLLLAARYADAEKGTFSQWNVYCGEAYFHAAVAAYLIGEGEQAAGHWDSMRVCLERALVYLGKAAILWPRFTDIFYTQAKCHALLGQANDATQKFEMLSDRDRRYFAKASQDGDFNSLRDQIEELLKRATVAPGPIARATEAKIDQAREPLAWAKRSAPRSAEDIATIESIERDLTTAKRAMHTVDVDIETLGEKVDEWDTTLKQIASTAFNANVDRSQRAIVECESRRSSCEYSIEQLKATMKQTSGAGMGCFFAAILVFFVLPLGTCFFASTLPRDMRNDRSLNELVVDVLVLGAIFGGILVWIVGAMLWRAHKNRPHRQRIQEQASEIAECVHMLPNLREESGSWLQGLGSFQQWLNARQRAVP